MVPAPVGVGRARRKGVATPLGLRMSGVCPVKKILYRVLYETAWHTYCTERRGRGSARGGRGAQAAHPDQTGRHRVAIRGTPRRLIFYEPRLVNRRTTRATPVWSSAGRRALGRPPSARRSASRAPKKIRPPLPRPKHPKRNAIAPYRVCAYWYAALLLQELLGGLVSRVWLWEPPGVPG